MIRYGLILALALVTGGCGDDPAAPEVLDTSAHAEAIHDWGNGIVATDVSWRLIAVEAPNGTRGSYNVEWTNGTQSSVTVAPELRFFDAGGFQLDSYRTSPLMLAAGEQRTLSGNFLLRSTLSVERANEIDRMEIWASFSEP